MTQLDKELLLKDLCARLPYGVKCSFGVDDAIYEVCGVNPTCCGASEIQATHIKSGINGDFAINACKPYLFPFSSMTEEQYEELILISEIRISFTPDRLFAVYKNTIEWFLKNHIDYNDLIGKGLAIDATNLNIY